MADRELRRLERRWKQTGLEEDLARLRRATERTGVCLHTSLVVEVLDESSVRGERVNVSSSTQSVEEQAVVECEDCDQRWLFVYPRPAFGYSLQPESQWREDGVWVRLIVQPELSLGLDGPWVGELRG